MARITVREVVHVILATPGRRDRDPTRPAPRGETRVGCVAPRSAANNRERALRALKQRTDMVERVRVGRCLRGDERARVGHLHLLDEYVLGEREHDRAGAARGRDPKGTRNELGNPGRVVDLRDPFRERAKHPPVVDLLEGLALHLRAGHLADEQHERSSVLERGVHPDRSLRCARSPRHHADPGRPVSFP